MIPGAFSDPGERLLAEGVPTRFFGFALVAHLGFWVLLGLRAEAAVDYFSGDWPVLAAVHLLTVGVLLTVALGASLQMLPVALSLNAPRRLPCNLAFAGLVLGTLLLVGGFEAASPLVLQHGVGAVLAAALAWLAIVAPMLAHAKVQGWARAFIAVACGGLLALLAAATVLALNYVLAWLPQPFPAMRLHAVLGGFATMGFFVFGFSLILVPMLALAPPPPERLVAAGFWTAVAALGLACAAPFVGTPFVGWAAAIAFAVAAAVHVETLRRTLKRRMKDRLGGAFVLIRASWAGLLAAAVAVIAAVAAPEWERGPALAAWLVLVGWLLTLLTGVLQRVIPFLASMHSGRSGAFPIPVSQLTAEVPLAVHRYAHLAAVVTGAAAIGLGSPLLMQVAATFGALGAAAFLAAAATTALRLRRLRQ